MRPEIGCASAKMIVLTCLVACLALQEDALAQPSARSVNVDEYEESRANLAIAPPIASPFAPAVLKCLDAAGYGPERDMLASILN
jgi:hypothetical protein